VDSKTSWPNYIAASNTNNKEEKKKLFQNHTKNVKAQIKDLSVKKYQDHIKNTPAFVILFMPVENMLLSALQEDKGLIEYAINLNIIPATPLNLIAILRTVEHGWRQEDVSANANKIKELGETLLTRLTTYFEHIDRMEDSIGKSVKHYNNAYASFDKKVIPQIEKFKKLGITSKKEIPQLNAIEELPRKSNKRKE
jgi:DNA recombination protein RmuC